MELPGPTASTDAQDTPVPAQNYEQTSSMLKPTRKRVRFDESSPQVRTMSPSREDEEQQNADLDISLDELAFKKRKAGALQTRLPGEDAEDLDETDFQRADQGAIKDFNPMVAAKRRAALREEHRRRNAIMDVSILPAADIAEAEEEYDEDEQGEMYLTGDIPIEPFNLKHERETGYFDVFGNYIEYRLDADARDAWLDSLNDAKVTRTPKATSSSLVAEVEQELDKEDIALYKRRMLALLEPGEDAFTALRRLGSRPTPPPPKQKHQPQEVLGNTSARQRQRKQQREQQQQQQQQVQQAGEMEAPLSNADPGMQASTRVPAGAAGKVGGTGAEKTAGTSAGTSTSSSAAAKVDKSGASQIPGPGAGSGGASSSGRGSGGGLRGPAMENSAEFDKLTEYADLLLGYGELGIYTKTKEQLTKELDGSEAGAAGDHRQHQHQQRQPQQQGEEDAAGDGSRLVEALLSEATPAEPQQAGSAVGSIAETAPASTGAQADDRDMFGESFEVQGAQADDRDMFGESFEVQDAQSMTPKNTRPAAGAAAAVTAPSAAKMGNSAVVGIAPSTSGGSAQPQQHALLDQELLQQLEALETQPVSLPAAQQQQQQLQQQQAHEGASVDSFDTPTEGATAQEQQQDWMVRGGFQLDPGSGMYYSSSLGLWYNTQTGLYMDAQSGAWYRITEAGDYQAAPEAGQGFGAQEEGVRV